MMDEMSQAMTMSEYLKRSHEHRQHLGLLFEPSATPDEPESISLSDLRDLATMQNLFYLSKFTSHRRIIGPFIVFFKESLVKILDPFLRRRLARQFEINQFTWNMARVMRQQNIEIAKLTHRINELEARVVK